MLRTFQQHTIRETRSLDGRWDFFPETDCDSPLDKPPSHYTRSIQVPSAWESLPGLEAYRGRAWYRTAIPTVADKAPRLLFGGVSHTATVYLDGIAGGAHYDAFTPWSAVIAAGAKAGESELTVEVDNQFGDHSALHKENDYYTYGGLTRPVELQYVPKVFIERLEAVPALQNNGNWSLSVKAVLRNWSEEHCQRRLAIQVCSQSQELETVTLPAAGEYSLSCEFNDLEVSPWSLQSPALHTITARLFDNEQAVDDLIERIGFRQIEVKGRKLLLNGEEIRLRGYNRHEDHPEFGCALPLQAMVNDLEIMRDLGCNFVRTSHYPNDARFLDLCDELGIAVWEESHARCVDFSHPRFRQQIADSTQEMIENHFNHPSILMWGCLNECDSISPEGREEHSRVISLIRRLDSSRPVTFASNKGQRDICLDLVDIVSWNHYPAWYSGTPADIKERLEKDLLWLHSEDSGGTGKPVIMSEFGAGAIYGERQRHQAKWSEEYQATVLDESLRVYLNHPDIVGAAIWQYCDVRVTAEWWQKRPRTMNNKGTVDEYRRPKIAYQTVKQRMLEANG